MPLSREQTDAFLEALRPNGHMASLTTHAGTFFSALIGALPSSAPYEQSPKSVTDPSHKLAAVLRDFADSLDRCAAGSDEQPF